MKAIILAAGLGSRLDEFGKKTPKCMITIFGKTTISLNGRTGIIGLFMCLK